MGAADADEFAKDLATKHPALGGFAGLIPLSDATRGMRDPQLAVSVDGVGTKMLVARAVGDFSTIGIDCVAMVVNDLLCVGARPLSFLDYIAAGRFDRAEAEAIMAGVAAGCEEAGCELLGGETAELPGLLRAGDYDLAGFGVGVVERRRAIDGSRIEAGDAIVGLPSSGIHSNGLSLARQVFPEFAKDPPLVEELLKPTRIYPRFLLPLLSAGAPIRGIAHITGGGLPRNLSRILPKGMGFTLFPNRWPVPAIFQRIARDGRVSEEEMYRVFNMGIGLCVVVEARSADEIVRAFVDAGIEALVVGEVVKTPISAKGAAT